MEKFTIEDYQEEVKVFKETTPKEADRLLETKTGEIVYIGFDSCPYCRKFVHKLSPLTEEKELEIHYVDAKNTDYTAEIKEFRQKYNVETVPGFLYSSETAGLIVKHDSSLTPEQILDIIEFNA